MQLDINCVTDPSVVVVPMNCCSPVAPSSHEHDLVDTILSCLRALSNATVKTNDEEPTTHSSPEAKHSTLADDSTLESGHKQIRLEHTQDDLILEDYEELSVLVDYFTDLACI